MALKYSRTLVGVLTAENMARLRADYETMLVTILDAILERFERDPHYPYLNTKFSTITGEDFAEPEDVNSGFKGKSAVFGWIQGRGLEALVGHILWLPHCAVLTEDEQNRRIERLTRAAETLYRKLEEARAANGGHLHFLMTPEGDPFVFDEAGRRKPVDFSAGV